MDRTAVWGYAMGGCSEETFQNKDRKKERHIMSNSNNSNRIVVPGAREAMDKFKMEAASEDDVPSTYYEIITDEQ